MWAPASVGCDSDCQKKSGLHPPVVRRPRHEDGSHVTNAEEPILPFTADNSLLINSGEFSGLSSQEAQAKMTQLAEQGGFGKATVTYRLKDWGISRQRD